MTREDRELLKELVWERNNIPQVKSWMELKRIQYEAPRPVMTELAAKVLKNEAKRWDEAQKRGKGLIR